MYVSTTKTNGVYNYILVHYTNIYMCICTCMIEKAVIYIYIYIYVFILIYLYVYAERESGDKAEAPEDRQ